MELNNHHRIETEIRVADLLALYSQGTTSRFLCFNIAKMIASELMWHPEWAGFNSLWEDSSTPGTIDSYKTSGFYYYDFIERCMDKDQFEKLVVAQLEIAIQEYFPTTHGVGIWSHYSIDYVAGINGKPEREFRQILLTKIVEKDPEAVFVIAC